ncbi:hypothetical protein [Pseudomonas aeruginosa]|uniref:hypothetical protein n=1 Tax=Pseudomonas aeruginosa TaxID=287 RepID=UPI003FD3F609
MVAAVQVQGRLVRVGLDLVHALGELVGATDDEQAILIHREQQVLLVRTARIHHEYGLHLVLGGHRLQLSVDRVAVAAGNGVNRDGGGIPYLALQPVDDVLLLGLGKLLPAVRHDPDFLDQSLQQALAERVGGHVHEVRVVAHREWVLFVGDPFQLLELGVAEVGVGP